jgi:hypothetical protein
MKRLQEAPDVTDADKISITGLVEQLAGEGHQQAEICQIR